MAKPILYRISEFMAKGLGTGYIPFMPGTWGSALGVGLVSLLGNSFLLALLIFFISWFVIWHYEMYAHTHDEPQVVIDEVSGIFFTFVFLPLTLPILIAGFLIFRFFDILKPFPIGWVDRNVRHSLGTLMDDVIAGAMSCLCLQIIVYWFKWL
ncbi:MAG: phosphatidylglycerophosphatase A [Bdellovibrionaceae bacterium]|nr:phosphatidylglycerophosphatase A [Pseudobdellovibrionaceae bacterium]